MITRNDEATYQDELGHFPLVRQVAETIQSCEPPYVIGICGPWGAGKTSFIRKLEVALGGEPEEVTAHHWGTPQNGNTSPDDFKVASARGFFRKEQRRQKEQRDEILRQQKAWLLNKLGSDYQVPGADTGDDNDDHNDGDWHLVRFNPWHYQFEEAPVVALLQEIRRNLSFKYKAWSEAGKILDVSIHAGLNLIGDVVKAAAVVANPLNLENRAAYSAPNISAKSIVERGIAYEDEHYLSLLSSQRFKDAFETAISLVVGQNGRLVIFIDDLDRCEGDIAFKLLESLKLHLNVRNCIYILGIDQGHLVETVARSLRGDKSDEDAAHWHARNYLDKLFQTIFLLPVPYNMKAFISAVLCANDGSPDNVASFDESFVNLLSHRFGWNRETDLDELIEILNQNLPHNPRKIKAFVASWKLNLRQLDAQLKMTDLSEQREPLYWKTSLVLNYLAFFEEPIFRRIEREPHFYFTGLQTFCINGGTLSPMPHELDRLMLTRDAVNALITDDSLEPNVRGEEVGKRLRPLYIASLIIDLSRTRVMNSLSTAERAIRRHLLATGGAWIDDAANTNAGEVEVDGVGSKQADTLRGLEDTTSEESA